MQQQEQKKDDEIVINLSEIFHALLRRWWILLICIVVGLVGGLSAGLIVQKDYYTITASYIVSYSGSDSSNDSASTMTTEYTYVTKVLNNCVEQVSTNKFYRYACQYINEGIDESSGDYITDEELSGYVSYSTNSTENTIMYVSVKTRNADLTYRIINTISGETEDADGVRHTLLSDYIKSRYTLTGLSSLEFSLINDLDKPTEPDSDSTVVTYTAVGAIGCLVAGIIVLACIQIFSQMVKGEEDLTSRYQLPVLASVPNFEDKQLSKGEYSYGNEKK
jgi:capsular polysaccharide biosynthesis protein